MSELTARGAPPRLPKIPALHFVVVVAVAALVLTSVAQVAPSPERLAAGVPRIGNLLARMAPPNLDPDFLLRVLWKLIETFQIAVAGTFVGIVLSLPVGWLAARGVTPLQGIAFLFKMLVSFFRTVPDLVWALVFVSSVGLGAVAGTMTIIVDTIGFCGRFFAEAMEDAEKEPQQALEAIGASRLSILLGAVIPSALPSMINTGLFSLEKAVRSSVVLGLVGAGGIGQRLDFFRNRAQWDKLWGLVFMFFLVVFVVERISVSIRRRLV